MSKVNRVKKKVDTSHVKVFKCPTDVLPVSMRGKINLEGGGKRGQAESDRDKAAKDEETEMFKGYFADVKEYGKSTLSGMAKKQHKSDKLTALGVRPEKKQTMPFKMAIGINDGRERRAARVRSEAKQSGTVLAKSLINAGKRERPDYTADRNSGPNIDVNVRGGVLRLNKDKMIQQD